jgi:hypothetical protein
MICEGHQRSAAARPPNMLEPHRRRPRLPARCTSVRVAGRRSSKRSPDGSKPSARRNPQQVRTRRQHTEQPLQRSSGRVRRLRGNVRASLGGRAAADSYRTCAANMADSQVASASLTRRPRSPPASGRDHRLTRLQTTTTHTTPGEVEHVGGSNPTHRWESSHVSVGVIE